jgi:[ribosomal protein S5]-alanine N-acetyltransferase
VIQIRVFGICPVKIETSNLILRRPVLSDVPELFQFLGDPEAMQYTHCDASSRQCRRRIAAYDWQRRKDGFGPWTIIAKERNQIIGWGGLYNDPFDLRWGVEVGYYLRPSSWGRGYASELVTAAIEMADHVLRLPEVWAFTRPDNFASARVLEKAGFQVARWVPEMERNLYRRGVLLR